MTLPTVLVDVKNYVEAKLHEADAIFTREKVRVADDVRVAVAKAEADAKAAVEQAAPEIKAAVEAAVKTITDAAVAALKAHGL